VETTIDTGQAAGVKPASRRIKLTIEYDGTDFAGFQLQGKGERTVQDILQRAVGVISPEPVIVRAAGRTDSGVHARGQVVDFDLESRIPTERIATALNGILPRDVSVRRAEEVDALFQSRFSARRRTYVYLVLRADQRSAIWGRYALWEPARLDLGAMRESARTLIGRRDFAAFANVGGDPGSTTVRDLMRFEVRTVGSESLVAILVTANGFLRSMVRNLVGGLLAVGHGQEDPSVLADIARTCRRTENPFPTAPAHGLCLLRVDY